MRKNTPLALFLGCFLAVATTGGYAATGVPSNKPKQFVYKNGAGKKVAVSMIDQSQKRKITAPLAKVDSRISPKLLRAATIAQDRAHAHSKSRCWRYVKQALVAADVVKSYPKTALAKQAGDELVRNHGFKKLTVTNPYAAPVGAILVYGATRAAGHVEIRTKTGFVSDFRTPTPSPRRLIGVYAKG